MSQSFPARRGRPDRDPHPIESILADRFSPATLRTYGQVAKAVDASGIPAADWLRQQIRARADAARTIGDNGLAMPKQTLTVYRAAVSHYIAEIEAPGGNARQIARALPSTAPLRAGEDREKMTPEQLARFRALAETAREPQRTLLLLLPLTACRISEICTLTLSNVGKDHAWIKVYAKRAKERRVPLSPSARRLLSAYLAKHAVTGARVFTINETWKGTPLDEPRACHPRDVWRVVETWVADRAPADAITGTPAGILHGVALHQTRHTAASAMVKRGANLAVVQDLLGHDSLKTMARYLHPDDDEKAAAVALLEPLNLDET